MRSPLLIGALALLLSACGNEPPPVQYGPSPNLPEPQRGLLPEMTVPRPTNWGNDRPAVPQGYTVVPIATNLRIPRQTLVLPNGDILVAEGKGGNAPALRPKDLIAGIIKSFGQSSEKRGDRLTLLWSSP
jgi:glucose/arabinose dehydrogenase